MLAAHLRMKNGPICFSLRKFLAMSPAIQESVGDGSCDAVVLRLGIRDVEVSLC